MGINIVRFQYEGKVAWGSVKEDKIYPIDGEYPSLASLINEGQEAARAALGKNATIEVDAVKLLSPVTQPARIVCQGANYSKHRAEAGLAPQRAPFNLIFTKADGSLCGANENIVYPDHVKLLDYEIELGLIIKKEITGPVEVTEDNLQEYIAGFVIANDISARDLQFIEGQWYKGKSHRTFCPTGPYVYLLDENEAHHVHNLELKLWVNGDLRQEAHTEQLLYKPEETLTELSAMQDFSPGDLLLTGTPGGVALALTSDEFDQLNSPFLSGDKKLDIILESQSKITRYLKIGDTIRCEIKSPNGKIDLGVQANKVVVQTAQVPS
jgi:2-keto-4-pentenoate hydratase/2-oxohepta-3-ene-1,7-dioic acid hydratase in catechol pathway